MSDADKKREHWRQWAIDGMPADKIRLADATWEAATEAALSARSTTGTTSEPRGTSPQTAIDATVPETRARLYILGDILLRYIDRLNDPIPEDSLEKIVKEMADEVLAVTETRQRFVETDAENEYAKFLISEASPAEAEPTADARGAARWIPVSERLPENNSATMVMAFSATGKMRVEHSCEVVGLWKDAQRNGEECALTHWMPLPDGPERP